MAEIEITLPTVQYGNVKVRATPEAFGLVTMADAYELGVATAVYLNLFQQGFKHGATMDVTAPQGAEQSEVDRVIEETVKAAQILADGLGGVTEVHEGMSEKAEQDAADMRARHREEAQAAGKAPWDQKVDAKPKPWETESKPVQSVSELISDEW